MGTSRIDPRPQPASRSSGPPPSGWSAAGPPHRAPVTRPTWPPSRRSIASSIPSSAVSTPPGASRSTRPPSRPRAGSWSWPAHPARASRRSHWGSPTGVTASCPTNWPIIESDGTVLPYPRSVHVRPDTIDLIPALGFLADRPRLTLGGGSEWALTPAELRDRWGGTAPEAGPLAAILLLEGVPGSADPSVTPISPAIAALELARSSWAASIAFGSTLARLAQAASSVPCARLRSGPLETTLDIVTGWLARADLAPAIDR